MSVTKTYVVTGGAGFIGSALVRLLNRQPEIRIVNVDKLTYAGNLSSLPNIKQGPNYRFAQIDICDQPALAKVFDDEQPDGIFHLAAESHVDRSIEAAGEFINTNVVGTMKVLEAARGFYEALPAGGKKQNFRLLHVSTDEVYGTLGDNGLFEETTAYDPRSPYSASKAGSDFLASAWFHTYGLPVVISNCSNNYGPFHFPEKLIPLMILNARQCKPLPVYGDGLNVRDWLYVDDHAKALQMILEKGRLGEKYNVGGRNERTNLDVVYAICDHLDTVEPLKEKQSRRGLIQFVKDRPGHDRRYAIDATKLEGELGWKAQETFETGIAKTIDWYRNNAWWWQPLQTAALERRGQR